jgi:hypothetical protein
LTFAVPNLKIIYDIAAIIEEQTPSLMWRGAFLKRETGAFKKKTTSERGSILFLPACNDDFQV